MLTTPSYESAPYTRDYDPELACLALAPYKTGTIGLVGTYQMSYALVDYVKRHPQSHVRGGVGHDGPHQGHQKCGGARLYQGDRGATGRVDAGNYRSA